MKDKFNIKKILLISIPILLGLFLSACGINMNTRLVINYDYSGYREINCTIDNRELENFVYGGIDGLELLIRQNIPPEMIYEITKEEKSTLLQFFIEFETTAEYKNKISKILGRESSSVVVIRDNMFLKGVHVSEDFSSSDLLAWLSQALIDNGIFSEESPVTINNQSCKLVIGKDEKVLGTDGNNSIDYSDIQDYGAKAVNVITKHEGGQFIRDITLYFGAEAVESLGEKEIVKYIKQNCSSKVSTAKEAENTVFTVTLKGESIEAVAEKTSKLIGGSTITYEYEYLPDFNVNITSYETFDFSKILSVNGTSNIASESNQGSYGMQPTIVYNYADKAAFSKIDVITDLSEKGRFTRSVKFYIPAGQNDFYRTEYQSIFMSDKIDEQVKKFGTILEDYYVYTWTFSADSIKAFNMLTTDLFKGSDDFSYKKEVSDGRVQYVMNDNINFRRTFPDMSNYSIQYTLIPPSNTKAIESYKDGKNGIILEYDKRNDYYAGHLKSDELTVNGDIAFSNYVFLFYLVFIILIAALIIVIFLRKIKKRSTACDIPSAASPSPF